MEAYVTLESNVSILKLTAEKSYGADKLCKSLNLVLSFFCIIDKGETLKNLKGAYLKGPAKRPKDNSELIFSVTAVGCNLVDLLFVHLEEHKAPLDSRENPKVNPSTI